MGVERTREGGNSIFTPLGQIPVGQIFTYEIRYERNVLSVLVNGGAPIQLSTFDLDAPLSYFKCGNYNQGDSPSSVHFFQIAVAHGSTPPPPSTTAHAVSTISNPGIGPSEVIWILDHTIAPRPPVDSPTGACDPARPTNASPNTVTLKLFFENSCCHPIETASIGQFNKCHNSNRPFTTLKQAVGANLFDRGLHIIAFAELNCLGPQAPANGISLTNTDVCAPAGNTQTFLSFMVVEPRLARSRQRMTAQIQ